MHIHVLVIIHVLELAYFKKYMYICTCTYSTYKYMYCTCTCICTSVILDPSYYYISSTVTSSQPVLRESTDSTDDSEGHALFESLTQPSRFDELIIGTQVPCTPGASQVNVLLYLEYFSTCISHYQHVL